MCATKFWSSQGEFGGTHCKAVWQSRISNNQGSRSYTPCWDDSEIEGRFVRAQEMSRYVEDGFFDCGLTGRDWVKENDSSVEIVADLIYSRASNRISKWVLAVPSNRKYVRFLIWKEDNCH